MTDWLERLGDRIGDAPTRTNNKYLGLLAWCFVLFVISLLYAGQWLIVLYVVMLAGRRMAPAIRRRIAAALFRRRSKVRRLLVTLTALYFITIVGGAAVYIYGGAEHGPARAYYGGRHLLEIIGVLGVTIPILCYQHIHTLFPGFPKRVMYAAVILSFAAGIALCLLPRWQSHEVRQNEIEPCDAELIDTQQPFFEIHTATPYEEQL